LIPLVNSLEEVIYGHGKVKVAGGSPAQSFRDLFLFSFACSSNSNYNKTQDTNNLKLIK
jgi:hypothetical protein